MEKEFLKKYECEDRIHSVVIEDDGKVAYAYLLKNKKIIGDVWLYNRCKAPAKPEWKNPELMPFANPGDFVKEIEGVTCPPESDKSFDIEWKFNINHEFEYVYIYLDKQIFAKISIGDKPGYCILAKRDGPLAKTLLR